MVRQPALPLGCSGGNVELFSCFKNSILQNESCLYLQDGPQVRGCEMPVLTTKCEQELLIVLAGRRYRPLGPNNQLHLLRGRLRTNNCSCLHSCFSPQNSELPCVYPSPLFSFYDRFNYSALLLCHLLFCFSLHGSHFPTSHSYTWYRRKAVVSRAPFWQMALQGPG